MMRLFAAFALVLLLAAPVWAQQDGLPADPRGAQSGRLEARERQALAALARNAATAQQVGTLATKRAGQGRLGELGQSMTVTNGGLTEQLAQLAGPENMPLRERIDQGEVQRLQGMASADPGNFSREVIAWINKNYPDTIRNMEMLGREDSRYTALADATLPQLRDQLSAAQQLAQAAMEGAPQQAQQPGQR
ncbi:MAG: DUF4142 domain-containing protein [Rhodospirillaceae bacterium]|nr:DUF4142 domain-containing protein [Rhodospirillales bacterium]